MRTLLVIGIGTGNPEHMTIQGIKALNSADFVLIPRKGESKADLAELRREICRRYLANEKTRTVEFDLPRRDGAEADYATSVRDWHQAVAGTYRWLIDQYAGASARVALLVWGDPSLYDGTLAILELLRGPTEAEFSVEVVPGISSAQALAASHRIGLATTGNAVHITTGRRLREGFPAGASSALVMLDGTCAFNALAGERLDIYWGAYLGTADEMIIAGPLEDVAQRIADARESARRERGWIMDTYLLRRR
ncbi:MAG: precorrin-6A synthase (deacetylating) [Stellaceae bacterium]